jgi:hypothetical protein
MLKLWDALAQLTQADKALNSQPNTRIWLEYQISQREGWGVFLWLWLMKTVGEAPQQPWKQQPQQVELVRYLYPLQGKLVVVLPGVVRLPAFGQFEKLVVGLPGAVRPP